jgi:chromosome segregation ATPase
MYMLQLEDKMKELKARIETAREQRTRAEGKLENLEKQEAELLKELEMLGVRPEELEEEIKRLEMEIKKGIQEVNDLLPKELV